MPRFGAVASFDDFAARKAARETSPLLRTVRGCKARRSPHTPLYAPSPRPQVEAWLRSDRDRKVSVGVSITETAERAERDESSSLPPKGVQKPQ
jgi:hypothetical protein